MRAIAINIGANTNEPGFRGPIYPDGSFEYIPIPESKSTRESVTTYGDLDSYLETPIPADLQETPVHLDPEFAEYPFCEQYTYGDDHGVKAGPLSSLSAGDYVLFYATLTVQDQASWLPPEWGAFCIGHFRLDSDPVTPVGDDLRSETGQSRSAGVSGFETNAHWKRDPLDARVLLSGDPADSQLYAEALPLSAPDAGVDANAVVTELSADSGRGPWWRRPLTFEEGPAKQLIESLSESPHVFGDYHR